MVGKARPFPSAVIREINSVRLLEAALVASSTVGMALLSKELGKVVSYARDTHFILQPYQDPLQVIVDF